MRDARITDLMVALAKESLEDIGFVISHAEMRAALEAALSAAPPSDDYRRGLEDAAKAAHDYLINENDELAATVVTVIRALGEKK